jgi:hypothetical protein
MGVRVGELPSLTRSLSYLTCSLSASGEGQGEVRGAGGEVAGCFSTRLSRISTKPRVHTIALLKDFKALGLLDLSCPAWT